MVTLSDNALVFSVLSVAMRAFFIITYCHTPVFYSFLFTQTLWLPRPSESIGEVLSFVSSFSSIEAAVRLRLLMGHNRLG